MGNGKISIIIGTLNEQEQIRDCLDSVKSIADEIIVADSVSSDRTVEICREYTDKIFVKPYQRYARTRNWMLQFVTNEWVLSIDADERFHPQLLDEIKTRLVKDKNSEINGYLFPYRYVCFGHILNHWKRHEEHLRLFRKDKGIWEDKEVHARLLVSGRIAKFNNHILHLPYMDFRNVKDKLLRYTLWDAEERLKYKRTFRWFNPFLTLLKPLYKFLQYNIRNKTFKDGYAGLKMTFFMSFYTFLVDVNHYRLVMHRYFHRD